MAEILNGFNRTGENHVTYENEYDLGFGRDMHMQTGGQDGTCANCTAFYVTNYASVEDAVAGLNHKATVAMEFSPPENNSSGAPFTKFFVFNPDGSIANSVALDDFGAKNVPSLCAVCHNGNTSGTLPADGNLSFARFIGFDLHSYRYAATKPRAPQESDFKAMNRAILNRTNVSTPLKLLITDWYGPTEGDTTLPDATFQDLAVPTQWTTPTDEHVLYQTVVQTSCRSCHTTRDPNDTGQDISWGSYDSLDNDSPFVRNPRMLADRGAASRHAPGAADFCPVLAEHSAQCAIYPGQFIAQRVSTSQQYVQLTDFSDRGGAALARALDLRRFTSPGKVASQGLKGGQSSSLKR